MRLLILEALGAFVLLLLIVWWTMFAGRNKGELTQQAVNEIKPKFDLSPEADQPEKRT